MLCWSVVRSTLLVGLALAQAQAAIDINRYPPQPQETICGDIVSANLGTGMDALPKTFNRAASNARRCRQTVIVLRLRSLRLPY
jgi:hypothetical protein